MDPFFTSSRSSSSSSSIDYRMPVQPSEPSSSSYSSTSASSAIPAASSSSSSSSLSASTGSNKDKNAKGTVRVLRACDACRKRKIRCDGVETLGDKCALCKQSNTVCEFTDLTSVNKAQVEALERKLAALKGIVHMLDPTNYQDGVFKPSTNSPSTTPSRSNTTSASSSSSSSSMTTTARRGKEDSTTSIVGACSVSKETSMEHDAAREIATAIEKMDDLYIASDRFIGRGSGIQLASTLATMNDPSKETPMFSEENPSLIEMTLMKEMEGRKAIEELPPIDLGEALVDAYFKNYNTIPCLLHRPYFERKIKNGALDSEPAFRALYFMVCALGSRVVQDSRLNLPTSPTYPQGDQSARGFEFFQSATRTALPPFMGATLEDLQMALLTAVYMLGAASPISAWAGIGFALRRAVDRGCHRENSPKWRERPLIDQLRKRAFYELIAIDRTVSTSLGRPLSIRDDEYDVALPIDISDSDLDLWDQRGGSIPPERFVKNAEQNPTPIAGLQSLAKLHRITGMVFKHLYGTSREVSEQKTMETVSKLDSLLNEWLDTIPAHLRWNPEQENLDYLLQSAAIFGWYYSCQILIHREFISSARNRIVGFPSLAIASNAARSCANVVDALKQRGIIDRAFWFAPLKAVNAGLILMIQFLGSSNSTALTSSAMRDVKRCIGVLKELSPQCFVAGKCHSGLSRLITMAVRKTSQGGVTPSSSLLKRSKPSSESEIDSPASTSNSSSRPSPQHNDEDSDAFLPNQAKKSRSGVRPIRPILPTKTSELGVATFNGRPTFSGEPFVTDNSSTYNTPLNAANFDPTWNPNNQTATIPPFDAMQSTFDAIPSESSSSWQQDLQGAFPTAAPPESLAQAHASLLASFGGELTWDSDWNVLYDQDGKHDILPGAGSGFSASGSSGGNPFATTDGLY